MADTREGKGNIFLKILIVILSVVLIYIIVTPWQQKVAADRLKLNSRERMDYIRSGLLYYIGKTGTYAPSLQELVNDLKNDPVAIAKQDSIFKIRPGKVVYLDSLLVSPVTKSAFIYQLNDSSAVKKYLLKCPGGSGWIGSLSFDDSTNKASWE
ncbi:MAG: hypothetical protein J0L62_04275 [Bacteroidetes bacterium]|nr:hypothetical protein [Bacteroidota bacterium]